MFGPSSLWRNFRTALFMGLAFWALMGAITMGNAVLMSGFLLNTPDCPNWVVNGLANLPYFLFWTLITPLIWLLIQRLPSVSLASRMIFFTGIGLFTALISFGVKIFSKEIVIHSGWPDHPVMPQFMRLDNLYPDLLVAAGTMVALIAWDSHRQYRERQLRTAELEGRLAKARLQSLRMQIHPHFLFNTLNTISALVERDPRETRRVIARLSDMLRTSLDCGDDPWVTVDDEIDFLEKYLDIERVRFGDRLSVVWNVASETRAAYIPSFLIQPLVENAIQHGVARVSGEGVIHIDVLREGGELAIRVRDNGPGWVLTLGPPEEGIGLANVRERVARHFGRNGGLSFAIPEGGGFEAILHLPFLERPQPIDPRGGLPN